MAIDSTYTFFRREFDDDHRRVPFAPVINTNRFVRKGVVRGSSVPPMHLGVKVSRAGSVGPSRGVAVGRTSFGGKRPVSIALHATHAAAAAVPFASLSGYQPKPIARRASIAAPGGSSFSFWRVGSGKPSTLSTGLSEVTKGSLGARSVYRPSSHAAYGRSAASIGVSQGDFGRSLPSARVPRSALARSAVSGTVTKANRGSLAPAGFLTATSKSRPVYRSASSLSFGWDEDLALTGPKPHRVHPHPPPLSSHSTKVNLQKTGKPLPGAEISSTSSKVISIKTLPGDFASVEAHPGKTSDNDIHRKKIVDYEDEMERIIPSHKESLSKLRAKALQAKDHLSQHKVLLDRYLPLHLGPESDVIGEVETRYGELLSRMPHLEPRKKPKEDAGATVIPPYKPAAVSTKGQKLEYDIVNIPVKSSFTPKISDTRKRARSVLCKIKGDPQYFNFS